MTVRYERPVSRSAYVARRLALLAFAMFVLGWGLHRVGPLETPFFLAIVLASAAISVVALYLAMLGLYMLWSKGAKGGKASGHSMVLVALPLATVLAGAINYANLPPIYDISSDMSDPPAWIVPIDADQSWLGKRDPEAGNDRLAQLIGYKEVTGRRYEGALDRVYTAALKVAGDTGIAVTEERGAPDVAATVQAPAGKKNPEEAVPDLLENVPIPLPRPENALPEGVPIAIGDAFIQGVHRTLIFGFRQDVVIRLREEAETTLVDIRVASRFGKHDLGTGFAFVQQYLRALDAELLGIAGD